jgi:hypothetical protein
MHTTQILVSNYNKINEAHLPMDTCEALAIHWRCPEERDLWVVSETGKSLTTDRSWLPMCRDLWC